MLLLLLTQIALADYFPAVVRFRPAQFLYGLTAVRARAREIPIFSITHGRCAIVIAECDRRLCDVHVHGIRMREEIGFVRAHKTLGSIRAQVIFIEHRRVKIHLPINVTRIRRGNPIVE